MSPPSAASRSMRFDIARTFACGGSYGRWRRWLRSMRRWLQKACALAQNNFCRIKKCFFHVSIHFHLILTVTVLYPCSLPVTIIEMSQLQKLRIQITAHSRLGTQHTHTPPHWFCCAACTSAWCCSAFAACWSSSMVHLFSAGGGEVNAARGSGTAAYAAASASASAALMGARLVSCHSFSARPMSEFI